MKFKHFIWMVLLLGTGPNAWSVQSNQGGMGEVLIFPYYTVNNDLNTLYSIVNTTDQAKVIKVAFLEGEIGRDVLTFQVYLSPHDVWAGALVATESTIPGHVGEPSVTHLTPDTTCAPFLTKFGQEFLPYEIDLDPSNDNMQRSREGYVVVIEMAGLTGDGAAAVDHGINGVPENCAAIENDWADDETWSLGDLTAPSGGLMGSASIVNVGQGLALAYDAIALQNFWQGEGVFSAPGSLEPDLSFAEPESVMLLDNGDLVTSQWSSGVEAVSALLMHAAVYNEYALDQIINGKTEWVLSFPTKRFHTQVDDALIRPFRQRWNGRESCDSFEVEIWDREAQVEPVFACTLGACPPPPALPEFCYATNTLEFLLPGVPAADTSQVLGSENVLALTVPSTSVAEGGWARIEFYGDTQSMIPDSGTGFIGLPVTGFSVHQFTNAGAAEGLLAQYGSLFLHKDEVVTIQGGLK